MYTKKKWTPERYEAFAAEIDVIADEVKAKLGPEDVAHVKKVRKISRTSEIIGRTLLQLSLDPLTWSAGVFSLWVHHQLESIEIGHSALHGAWDATPGLESLDSSRFRWVIPIDEESWKREHNILHHQYTNIVGRDPDLNYGPLRSTEKTKWIPYHLIQVGQFFWTAPVFVWVVALHASGLTDLSHPPKDSTYANVLPDKKIGTIAKAFKRTVRKMVPYSLYHFVFWPALAGPFWWKVLGGNVTADILRSVYTCATIYAGHFGDDLLYSDPEYRPKGRGEWYKMQIESAHNYAVPPVVSLLCGALDYQIEHHLFPKFPPNRLREIAPKIEAVCKRYGVRYNKGDWGKTLKGTLRLLKEMSTPPGGLKGLVRSIPLLGPRLQSA